MADENKSVKRQAKPVAAVKREEGKPSFLKRVAKWWREMRSELKKVVWPTPKQILNNTGVALFMMGVAAIVIWGFDGIAEMGVKTLIRLVG